MQRRSVVGRLAATVAGLSLAKVPDLTATPRLAAGTPWATPCQPPESAGSGVCPQCSDPTGERYDAPWDDLLFTPAGMCLICAHKANPSPTITPYSDPFWILTPEECKRLEPEMERIAAELDRINKRLDWLETYDPETYEDKVTVDGLMERWNAISREGMALHVLYAASRQFRR